LLNKMTEENYQTPKHQEDSIRKYDEFKDRFKTWEQIKTERYNSC